MWEMKQVEQYAAFEPSQAECLMVLNHSFTTIEKLFRVTD